VISIVIPCFNESAYIEACVSALLAGTFANIEILVVDGGSTDASPEIIRRFMSVDKRVKLLSNLLRITPVSLNIGIQASQGEFVAILGAHSMPAVDWVASNLECLKRHPEAIAVGGTLNTISIGLWGKAIGTAMSSPFGVGNAKFRVGGTKEEPTDTVVFGCYRRKAFEKYGLFDEALATNQDDEYNLRLIHFGEKLIFSPDIRCAYYSRSTLRKVINQYWRYGFFKFPVMNRNRMLGSTRQLIPSLAVALFFTLLALSFASLAALYVLCSLFTIYLALGLLTGMQHSAGGKSSVVLVPAAILAVHVSYGIGFLVGIVAYGFNRTKSRIPRISEE
jgi:glycosyltransferase involved in cell wall biosynthesis